MKFHSEWISINCVFIVGWQITYKLPLCLLKDVHFEYNKQPHVLNSSHQNLRSTLWMLVSLANDTQRKAPNTSSFTKQITSVTLLDLDTSLNQTLCQKKKRERNKKSHLSFQSVLTTVIACRSVGWSARASCDKPACRKN